MDIRTPASHNSDPSTSHEAEDAHNKSGQRRRQQKEVLAMLKRNEGCTGAEIARNEGVCKFMVRRRLSDLNGIHAFQGKPRICSAANNGRKAVTWYSKL